VLAGSSVDEIIRTTISCLILTVHFCSFRSVFEMRLSAVFYFLNVDDVSDTVFDGADLRDELEFLRLFFC